MESTVKYCIGNSPDWSEKLADSTLLSRCLDDQNDVAAKDAGKALCYINSEIINTSNEKTEAYFLKVWSLNSPHTLQIASAGEIPLSDKQHLVMHRVAIIRQNQIIEMTDHINTRVLDDEQLSAVGLISKFKKLHWTIEDLHVNDTFIMEYSVVSTFGTSDSLDKKYFRHVQIMPWAHWHYKSYSFKIINSRKEKLLLAQKYFRDVDGNKIDSELTSIQKGDHFIFTKTNFQSSGNTNTFLPYLEIATEASWSEIANQIYLLNVHGLASSSEISNSQTVKDLTSGQNTQRSIRNIIEFVQDQVVYLFDAEIMHGHVSQLPVTTLRQKSGDCKAKSLLLASLLSVIGIESHMILVNYRQDYFIPESLPSPFVFGHAIVKILYEGKEYFVDPTWFDRKGLLGNRTEPIFQNYLPVKDGADLSVRSPQIPNNFNIEESVEFKLEEGQNCVHAETIFRIESADIVRATFKKTDRAQLVEEHNKFIMNRLSLNEHAKTSELFDNVEYRITEDDQDSNTLKVAYSATISQPYVQSKRGKIFRYYNILNVGDIISHNHKDLKCYNDHLFPMKSTLSISSDDYIQKRDPLTVKQTEIHNNYFHFSNKKKFSPRTVVVTTEFMPKVYGYIKDADLEKMKEDYAALNNSNFGIGIVLVEFWRYILPKSYLFVIIYIIIRILLSAHQ